MDEFVSSRTDFPSASIVIPFSDFNHSTLVVGASQYLENNTKVTTTITLVPKLAPPNLTHDVSFKRMELYLKKNQYFARREMTYTRVLLRNVTNQLYVFEDNKAFECENNLFLSFTLTR